MFGSSTNSPTMSRSQSLTSNSPKSESPTPSLTNLHIEDPPKEKSRYEEQIRLREEYKRRQREAMVQAKELERVKLEQKQMLLREHEKARLAQQQQLVQPQQPQQQVQPKQPQQVQTQQPQQRQQVQPQQRQQVQPQQRQQVQPQQLPPHQQQPQHKEGKVKGESDDDDLMVDEEMTNKNVCMGMVKTDIVVEKSPLILIRDDQYEIVSLESEGKLNTENYSFKVTSRSQPTRFVSTCI